MIIILNYITDNLYCKNIFASYWVGSKIWSSDSSAGASGSGVGSLTGSITGSVIGVGSIVDSISSVGIISFSGSGVGSILFSSTEGSVSVTYSRLLLFEFSDLLFSWSKFLKS